MLSSPIVATTSLSGNSMSCCCKAEQVIGWPWDRSGGAPAASAAMILPSRSPQASASASTLMPGFFASKRWTMLSIASIEVGLTSVCQTRTTLSWARAVPTAAHASRAAAQAKVDRMHARLADVVMSPPGACRRALSAGPAGRSLPTPIYYAPSGPGDVKPAPAGDGLLGRATRSIGRAIGAARAMLSGMTVRSHFRKQAAACARLGSPFTARVLELAAEQLGGAGQVGRTVLDWPGDPTADALALRLAGGLHALVLSGAAPESAAVYPRGARAGDPAALWPAI